MSTSVAAPSSFSTGDDATPASVRPAAFYLHSDGGDFFCWLHEPADAVTRRGGVVICPPVGYEQVHSHRSLRHLAEELAAAGYSVLRIDFHGTGDSPGGDEDADRWPSWQQNVRRATEWMRAHVAGAPLSLIGLRIGGSLAMIEASARPVDQLVLWQPVIRGRTYLREMRALSLTAAASHTGASDGCLEAAGFLMTPETAGEVNELDLLQLRPQCSRTLLLTAANGTSEQQLADHFRNSRAAVTTANFAGYVEMMSEPHKTEVPHDAIRQIADWLTAEAPPAVDRRTATAMFREDAIRESVDVGGGVRERPWIISAGEGLSGIITQPAASTPLRSPWVILLNAGSTYRVGPNRLSVQAARQLACSGFRVLRMDVGGLGDSPAARGRRENDCYTSTAFRDVDAVIRALESELAAGQVVLAGLCSGAYLAFQMAAQSTAISLVESVLINPLTYHWSDEMSAADIMSRDFVLAQYYWRSALRPDKWWKMLTGRTEIGVAGALRMFERGIRLRRGSKRRRAARGKRPELGHPPSENIPADVDAIRLAGRQMTCLFSDTDPGYRILLYHASRAVRKLRRSGRYRDYFIANADHTFSGRAARQKMVETLSRHLASRYPAK